MSGALSSLRIRGARVVGRESAGPQDVDIEGDRIVAVEPAGPSGPRPGTVEVDAGGLLLAAGFIDLQVNGAAGRDLTADPGAIWEVGAALPRWGVTAFLPTVVTAPREVIETARRTLVAGPPRGYAGAEVLGLHVEGPFLAEPRIGAHDPVHRRDPDPAFVEGWSAADGVRVVTLAPELPGGLDLIAELVRRGIVVSVGHTAATAAQTRAAFDAGASYVTHLFNAMPELEHREPGPVGAALADARIVVGIIPDGLHVEPTVVALAWRVAGAGRVSVVTDSIAALGVAPGSYRLGTMDLVVDESSARLADGRLAGSVLSLDVAVRNVRSFTGASPAEALGTVTSTPARLLGLRDRIGGVAPGGLASLSVVTPELRVAATVVAGVLAYRDAGLVG